MINYKTVLTVRTDISTEMGAQVDNFSKLLGDLIRLADDHIESHKTDEIITREDLETARRVIRYLKENNTHEIDCVSWDSLEEGI